MPVAVFWLPPQLDTRGEPDCDCGVSLCLRLRRKYPELGTSPRRVVNVARIFELASLDTLSCLTGSSGLDDQGHLVAHFQGISETRASIAWTARGMLGLDTRTAVDPRWVLGPKEGVRAVAESSHDRT